MEVVVELFQEKPYPIPRRGRFYHGETHHIVWTVLTCAIGAQRTLIILFEQYSHMLLVHNVHSSYCLNSARTCYWCTTDTHHIVWTVHTHVIGAQRTLIILFEQYSHMLLVYNGHSSYCLNSTRTCYWCTTHTHHIVWTVLAHAIGAQRTLIILFEQCSHMLLVHNGHSSYCLNSTHTCYWCTTHTHHIVWTVLAHAIGVQRTLIILFEQYSHMLLVHNAHSSYCLNSTRTCYWCTTHTHHIVWTVLAHAIGAQRTLIILFEQYSHMLLVHNVHSSYCLNSTHTCYWCTTHTHHIVWTVLTHAIGAQRTLIILFEQCSHMLLVHNAHSSYCLNSARTCYWCTTHTHHIVWTVLAHAIGAQRTLIILFEQYSHMLLVHNVHSSYCLNSTRTCYWCTTYTHHIVWTVLAHAIGAQRTLIILFEQYTHMLLVHNAHSSYCLNSTRTCYWCTTHTHHIVWTVLAHAIGAQRTLIILFEQYSHMLLLFEQYSHMLLVYNAHSSYCLNSTRTCYWCTTHTHHIVWTVLAHAIGAQRTLIILFEQCSHMLLVHNGHSSYCLNSTHTCYWCTTHTHHIVWTVLAHVIGAQRTLIILFEQYSHMLLVHNAHSSYCLNSTHTCYWCTTHTHHIVWTVLAHAIGAQRTLIILFEQCSHMLLVHNAHSSYCLNSTRTCYWCTTHTHHIVWTVLAHAIGAQRTLIILFEQYSHMLLVHNVHSSYCLNSTRTCYWCTVDGRGLNLLSAVLVWFMCCYREVDTSSPCCSGIT